MNRKGILIGLLVCAMTVSGYSQGAPATNGQYLVEFKGSGLPANLSQRVSALGGTIVDTFPEIQTALLGNLDDSRAAILAKQPDVIDVTSDELMAAPPGVGMRQQSDAPALIPMSASQPATAKYFRKQWDKRTIHADQAWNAGYLGSPDVRIAILDSGIDPTHRDVGSLIDRTRSTSFCPGEDALVAKIFPGYPAWTDLGGHGTFTASVASSNGVLTAGVTSRSTLMAVKVLGRGCYRSAVFRGLAFATRMGADVINMSLTIGFFPQPRPGQKGFFHYYHLYAQYALTRGVSAVVVAAGNSSVDIDHDRSGIQEFCDVPGVMCVSATGPTDSGPAYDGPFLNVDVPAFYTNYGVSAIDVAAPGGNASFDSAGNVLGIGFVWAACATTEGDFDDDGNFTLSVCADGQDWISGGLGTSGAAPHVAGLAALLVSKFGHGNPAQVRAAIENSADDLGKPGADPYYGKGRINVARALGIEP